MGYVDAQSLSFVLPDGRVLFDDVSFRVGAGATTALIGANGTGKTTLLRIIAGDLAPSAGTVARTGGLGVMRQSARPAHLSPSRILDVLVRQARDLVRPPIDLAGLLNRL